MKARIDWIDYAKGIGIVLVVFGHVLRGVEGAGLPLDPGWFEACDRFLYSFHMPLFFFLSGLLLAPGLTSRGPLGLCRSKVGAIAFPYLLWSLIQVGSQVALSAYTNHQPSGGDLLRIGYRPQGQFWFLYALFLCFLAGAGLHVMAGRRAPGIALVAGLLLFLLNPFEGAAVPRDFCAHFVYFAAGWLGYRLVFLEKAAATTGRTAAVTCVVFAAAEAAALAGGWSRVPPVALALAAAGTATVIAGAAQISSRRRFALLLTLGRLSMPIYLAHTLVASAVRLALSRGFEVENIPLHLAAGTLAGLAVPVGLYHLAGRFRCQWIFGLSRGSGGGS